MFRNIKVLVVVLAVIALAVGTYAFAASNTVDPSAAGSSAATVAGYTATHIAYNLDADPTMVDTITFAVAPTASGAPAATTVKLQTAAAGAWTDCTLVAGTGSTMNATCDYTGAPITVLGITAFNLVATSSYVSAP